MPVVRAISDSWGMLVHCDTESSNPVHDNLFGVLASKLHEEKLTLFGVPMRMSFALLGMNLRELEISLNRSLTFGEGSVRRTGVLPSSSAGESSEMKERL
jgi:hypothetical protein